MKTSLKNKLFCPYTKSLESGKVRLELKRGDRVRVQRGRVKFIASPIPCSRQLKIWSFHVVVVPCVQGMWTEAIGLQFCEQKAVVMASNARALLKSTATAATASLLSILFLQSSVIFSYAEQQEWVFINPDKFEDKTV